MKTLPIILVLIFSGCALTRGRITSGGLTVTSPKDGNSASIDKADIKQSVGIPAGSVVKITKWEPVAWHPATADQPEVKAQPGREVTEVELSRDTQWRKDETKIVADTGTVDTSIAKHRIDAAENRYLLFAAIGAAVAGGFFLYIKYPTPALMCGGASIVFFLAWKLADLPDWFWAVGMLAIGGGVFLWLGHKRGENDGVKAALAGDVEPKSTPVVKS